MRKLKTLFDAAGAAKQEDDYRPAACKTVRDNLESFRFRQKVGTRCADLDNKDQPVIGRRNLNRSASP